MDSEEFEQLIQEALADLPLEFKQALDNIAILVEDDPSQEQYVKTNTSLQSLLFGLYQGVPLTKRGGAQIVMPDRITLFKNPIISAGRTPEGIRKQLYSTLFHEIGHYFGMSEKQLRELHHGRTN